MTGQDYMSWCRLLVLFRCMPLKMLKWWSDTVWFFFSHSAFAPAAHLQRSQTLEKSTVCGFSAGSDIPRPIREA